MTMILFTCSLVDNNLSERGAEDIETCIIKKSFRNIPKIFRNHKYYPHFKQPQIRYITPSNTEGEQKC